MNEIVSTAPVPDVDPLRDNTNDNILEVASVTHSASAQSGLSQSVQSGGIAVEKKSSLSGGSCPPSSEDDEAITPATHEGGRGAHYVDPEQPATLVPTCAQGSLSTEAFSRTSLPTPSRTVRLSDIQLNLQKLRNARRENTLMSRYLLNNAIQQGGLLSSSVNTATMVASPAECAPARVFSAILSSSSKPIVPHHKSKQVYRYKLVLLGHQEVGKTSLRKCFMSEPFFFKRLPDVRATTGVEMQEKSIGVDGDVVGLVFSDFAGQESYHSHTFFLTERSIFGLVWKISAVEQDFQSCGISAREEERLFKWITEVYAKFPRARLVLIATHLDELRVQGQRSVEMILNKVEGKIQNFINKISFCRFAVGSRNLPTATPSAVVLQPTIVGNFAVSCKTRQVIAAGGRMRTLSGRKISALLRYLAGVAKQGCLTDREYPGAAVPGRHMKLMEAIEQLRRTHPQKLLLSIEDFVQMALQVGVESDTELLQAARLLHTWDVIHLFCPYHMEDNVCIMLHPRWLRRLAAIPFSYAHILRTPLHLRSYIGGLEYTVSQAEAADLSLMRKGFLRWPLARVLFNRPLADFLKREPDDSDVLMCLQLLEAMHLLYTIHVPCDDLNVLLEETPVEPEVGVPVLSEEKVCRYFIPSLSPYNFPVVLQRLIPVLLRGVSMRMEFNLLPDEFWWRLQCKLHHYIQEVSVHQPHSGLMDNTREAEMALLDGLRLKEADEEHNRWCDAMWLSDPVCRVLLRREGPRSVFVHVAETSPGGSQPILQDTEDAIAQLLREYQGVQRVTYVACPSGECDGWMEAEVMATQMSVTCPTCSEQFESKRVMYATAAPLNAKKYTTAVLNEVGELLSLALSYRSSLFVCRNLGIPYTGPLPSERDSQSTEVAMEALSASGGENGEEANMGLLHALDKLVQVALFLSWMDRVEEQEKQKRMLETDASPMFY